VIEALSAMLDNVLLDKIIDEVRIMYSSNPYSRTPSTTKDVGEAEMTIATLERRLKPLVSPVENELLRWLYLQLPPRPIKSRKMHRGYSEAVRILMRESGSLEADNRAAVGQYLNAVIPFIEQYEKKEFPIGPATPEEMLGFLMEQHDLSQYDLAKELGGQPQVLRRKRKLTREHIERLSKRFRITPATFYPAANLG
jgi:HTH-type transcriptional regulator/antitoxin HigA